MLYISLQGAEQKRAVRVHCMHLASVLCFATSLSMGLSSSSPQLPAPHGIRIHNQIYATDPCNTAQR
jgi:hypothetical protein